VKKTLLILLFLLSHFCNFGQTILIKNPAIPNPRPQLSQTEILDGKLRDFNHLKTDNNTYQRPTGVAQRLIASSEEVTSAGPGPLALIDSERYTYSGTRGCLPTSQTGNITSIALFDTSFHVLPDFNGYPQGGRPYTSYLYNSNNTVAQYNAYDSTKTLVVELWRNYFANDSLSGVKSIITTNNYDVIQMRETLYNTDGKVTRDSNMVAFVSVGGSPNDSACYLKKVFFDNLGRIDHTDSTYSENATASTWQMGNRLIIENIYNSNSAVFPDRDTIINIEYDLNTGVADTLSVVIDDYQYDATNKITVKIMSQLMPASMPQPGLMLISKEIYSYNNAGQISTWLSQAPSNNTWVDNLKETYEYQHNINTLYTYSFNSGGAWIETNRSVSTLDENYIIDSIKTYQDNTYGHLTTISVNSFRNVTKESNFVIQNNSVLFFGNYNYYYDEYDDPTSLKATQIDNLNLKLFPVPATNMLHYSLEDAGAKDLAINIIDLSGKLLYKKSTQKVTGTIDISNLKTGLYLFEITNIESAATQRIKFTKE
jgi:hypothetical protein